MTKIMETFCINKQNNSNNYVWYWGTWCRYRQEGRGFDSQCCHWNFSLTQSMGLTQFVTKMRGKGDRCVGLKTLPHSFADYIEICHSQAPETLRACPGLKWDCFTFTGGVTVQPEPRSFEGSVNLH